MYCSKCGERNPEGSSFCQACGAALSPAQPTPPTPAPAASAPPVAPVAKRTSGLAVAALVLGIVGFFTGLPSILAIIFGGVALGQIAKDPNHLEGRGLAVAGLVMGIVWVVLWTFLIALVFIGAIATSTTFG